MDENTTCAECDQPGRYNLYDRWFCTNHRGLAERYAPTDFLPLYTVTITWSMSTGKTYTSVETRDADELRRTREMARGMGRDYLTRVITTAEGDVYLNPNHIVSTTIHVADYLAGEKR